MPGGSAVARNLFFACPTSLARFVLAFGICRLAVEREKALLLDAVSASQHELQQRIQMWKEIETDVKDGSKV
jgi:hypothetical protein